MSRWHKAILTSGKGFSEQTGHELPDDDGWRTGADDFQTAVARSDGQETTFEVLFLTAAIVAFEPVRPVCQGLIFPGD